MKAWHFLLAEGRLQFGRRYKVQPGAMLRLPQSKPLIMCSQGFHASRRAIDALSYAPGPIICRVELSGEILHGTDKLVARERTVLWMADATNVLHEFACRCADDALSLDPNPDPPSVAAVKAKRAWLAGRITDDDLRAARYAARAVAWDAARDAARAAARAAARDSAWYAARAAAWDAALAEARAAAWDAARDSARDAARAAQNRRLTAMLSALHTSGASVAGVRT